MAEKSHASPELDTLGRQQLGFGPSQKASEPGRPVVSLSPSLKPEDPGTLGKSWSPKARELGVLMFMGRKEKEGRIQEGEAMRLPPFLFCVGPS